MFSICAPQVHSEMTLRQQFDTLTTVRHIDDTLTIFLPSGSLRDGLGRVSGRASAPPDQRKGRRPRHVCVRRHQRCGAGQGRHHHRRRT